MYQHDALDLLRQRNGWKHDASWKHYKKLDCTYRVLSQHPIYKHDEQNFVHIQLDTDLSPVFTAEHLDFQTGKSLTVSLTDITQPRWGKTVLSLLVTYINEKQELFRAQQTELMPSIKGSAMKKLEKALEAFQTHSGAITQNYLTDGYKPVLRYHAENLANYFYECIERSGKFYGFTPSSTVNTLLLFYSRATGDSLKQDFPIYDLSSHFVSYSESPHPNFWHPQKPWITPEERDLMDAILSYDQTNWQKINQAFSDNSALKIGKPLDEDEFFETLNFSDFLANQISVLTGQPTITL